MVISNFSPRVILRDDDRDPCNTDAETNCINPARWNNRNTSRISARLQKLANSPPKITEIARTPSKPSALQLNGNAKRLSPRIACHGELEPEDPQMPDEVIRNFRKNDKFPSQSPSRSFVKKLVTALEGKRQASIHCKADDEFLMCYHSRTALTCIDGAASKTEIESFPAHHHRDMEQITEFRGAKIEDETQSQVKSNKTNWNDDERQCTEFRGVKIEDATCRGIKKNETNRSCDGRIAAELLRDANFVEETNHPIKNEKSKGARPKYRETVTKKPVCLESRSIYRTPEKRKTIPRKRSFKNLMLTLTDWAGKRKPAMERKKVLFEYEDKVSEVISSNGEKAMNQSQGTTSLQFIANELSHLKNIDSDARGSNSTFSTFLKSSSSENSEVDPNADNSERDSNFSIVEKSAGETNIRPSRVKQIAQLLSNLPNHPWTDNELKFRRPCLLKPMRNASATCGEVAIELRRNLNESLYDIPNSRPRPNDCEETVAMKRKHLSLPNSTGNGNPLFVIEEETHYAIVRPKTVEGCVRYGNLVTINAGSIQNPIEEMKLK